MLAWSDPRITTQHRKPNPEKEIGATKGLHMDQSTSLISLIFCSSAISIGLRGDGKGFNPRPDPRSSRS